MPKPDFVKGFPAITYHESLQNSFVVVFLNDKKMWKVTNTPENPIAANTYNRRMIFITKYPVSDDASNLVRTIMICMKTKKVNKKRLKMKAKKYL